MLRAEQCAELVLERRYVGLEPGPVCVLLVGVPGFEELVGEHEMGVQQRWPFMVRGRDGFWRMPKDRPSIPQMWSFRARKAG